MSASNYIKDLRAKIGNTPLLLPCVGAVILNQNRELLLQQKQNGIWSLPAGMIEPGESPANAVIREVQEETGLIVNVEKILGVFGGSGFAFTYENGDQVEYIVILFKCHVTGHSECQIDQETAKLGYFSKQSLPELALPYPLDCLFDELKLPLAL